MRRLSLAIALFAAGCTSANGKPAAPPPASAASATPRARAVRVAAARAIEAPREERYVGELVALGTVDLMSTTGGRLVRVTKRIGDPVAPGEVVAILDDEELRRQMAEARLAVQAALAQVSRAKIEVRRNALELERAEALFRRKAIADRERDHLAAAADLARANLALAEVQVEQAKARVETLSVQLRNTRIRAPFRGRVSQRYLDPGAVIVAMNPKPIVQIVTSHALRVRFKVPERDLGELPLGKKVTVHVDAFPGEGFEGKITRLGAAVDPASRSVLAEATLRDRSGRLRPGMFARVDVLWRKARPIVLVPDVALVRASEGSDEAAVWVHQGGIVRLVPVRVGRSHGREIEVQGIAAGTEVVVSGHEGLASGAAVEVSR